MSTAWAFSRMALESPAADARHMNNVLHPEDLDLNRSGRMSERQRAALAREAKGGALSTGLVTGFLAWHVWLGPGLNVFAGFIALGALLAAARFGRVMVGLARGRAAHIDGTLRKQIERDEYDAKSHFFLVEETRFAVSADDFWRLPEGGPYRIWFCLVNRTVLNAEPLAGWAKSSSPEYLTWSEVIPITPAEEPQPPADFYLRESPFGGWLLEAGLREWLIRPGELLNRGALSWRRDWVRMVRPRLCVQENRVGDQVAGTLSVASAGGTRRIISSTSDVRPEEESRLLRLARFAAARTGIPLEVEHTQEPHRNRKGRWSISLGVGE